MKKIITLICSLNFIIGNAQCPAPSNLTLSFPDATSAQLIWSENGIANTWEIAIIPDFIVGTPLPSDALYVTASNPFIITGLSPAMGCNVFFVRSVCSTTVVSPWVAVGTLGCSTNVYNYLATLSTSSFNFNATDDLLNVYPNPTKEILNIVPKNNSPVTSIIIYNTLGQEVTAIVAPATAISISNLKTGTYFIKVTIDNKESVIKFVKE